jgi:hypothetical protein
MKVYKNILPVCIVLLAITACTKDDIFDKLPVGTYSSNEHLMILGSEGNFKLENYPNVNDYRSFAIEGSYTYTRDLINKDEGSYGKITFTVSELYLEGLSVSSLYLDEDYGISGSLTVPGDVLEGWWSFSDNITWGGKMRIWFNWPDVPRRTNYYDGHNELFSGDPL